MCQLLFLVGAVPKKFLFECTDLSWQHPMVDQMAHGRHLPSHETQNSLSDPDPHIPDGSEQVVVGGLS